MTRPWDAADSPRPVHDGGLGGEGYSQLRNFRFWSNNGRSSSNITAALIYLNNCRRDYQRMGRGHGQVRINIVVCARAAGTVLRNFTARINLGRLSYGTTGQDSGNCGGPFVIHLLENEHTTG